MNKSTLKELTYKIGSGATPSGGQKSYHNDGVSLIRSQNVHDFRFSTNGLAFICEEQATSLINVEVKVNDILLNITGDSIARACMVSNNVLPARVNQHVAIIRANDKIDCNYLLCYLVNLKPYLLKICGVGGTRNALTKEAIEKLEIQYPSKKSQERIGGIIQNINSKIELNNRINAELESMAKTIYDYWFVQFDFPDKNGKPYKTSGGKMVWNEELKREIPEGWEVKKIKEISETGSGGTPLSTKREFYENGNIPWINSGEVNSSFIIDSKKYISEEGLNNSSAKIFPKGSILMAMYGATAGQVSLIDFEACTNQAICSIMPFDIRHIPYLKFGLHQLYQYLVNLSSGSARDNLSQDKIRDLIFVLPNDRVLNIFF
jgi:type I restriction enzyme S subunit